MPGPSRQQGVVKPGSGRDRQQDDGVEDQTDVWAAEDCKQREKHQADDGRNRSEHPGDAPIADKLFLNRFNP